MSATNAAGVATRAATTSDDALQYAGECLLSAQSEGSTGDHGASWVARAEAWMRLAAALGQSSSSVTS